MSRRQSTFQPKRHYSAEKMTAILNSLLSDPNLKTPRGAEKTFFLSPNVADGFAVYNIYFYSEKRNDRRQRRMDVFATLGSTFSPDYDCTPTDIDTLTSNIKNLVRDQPKYQGLLNNLQDLRAGKEHRKPILVTQPNWSAEKNGSYVLLRDLLARDKPITDPGRLILEILSSLSYAEAAGLSIDDLKDDNILVTHSEETHTWNIKLIDLGPMDYRFFDTFIPKCAYVDPRQWEKLRAAYLIHQIASEPNQRNSLVSHQHTVREQLKRLTDTYEYDVLKHWANHRTPVVNASHEALITLLCDSGRTDDPEKVASYPLIINTWINRYTPDKTLSKETIKATKKMVMLTCADYVNARRERALTRRSAHEANTPLANRPASRSVTHAAQRLSKPVRPGDGSPGALDLSTSITDTSQDEATLAVTEIQTLIRETIDFKEAIRDQSNREKLIRLRSDMGEELNTILTLREHNNPNPLSSPFTVDTYKKRLREIAHEHLQQKIATLQATLPSMPPLPIAQEKATQTELSPGADIPTLTPNFNALQTLFPKTLTQRHRAIAAAALCSLLGSGGLGVGVYFLLKANSIEAITVTIIAFSAILLLSSAAPVAVACKRHPKRFFEDPRALSAANAITKICNQYNPEA